MRSFLPILTLAAVVIGCEHQGRRLSPPVAAPEREKLEERVATPSESQMREPAPRRSVILVTIDGVRWQDVFEGVDKKLAWASRLRMGPTMPRTMSLVESRGIALGGGDESCGIVAPSNKTFLSLPGYHEILGGRSTTCTTNTCRRTTAPTILDAAVAAGIGPVASIGSWDALDRAASNGTPGPFVSEGRGASPATTGLLAEIIASGDRARAYPGMGDYRPDEHTERLALAYLREERPAFLHIGLGDTDEWAHRGEYAAYVGALRSADAFVGELARTLDEIGLEAAVLVTSDHGRSRWFRDHGAFFPESARSFLLGFGAGVATHGAVCANRDVTLADVGATARALLELPPDDDRTAGSPIAMVLADQFGTQTSPP